MAAEKDPPLPFDILDLDDDGDNVDSAESAENPKKDGGFSCPECDRTFGTALHLGGHRYQKHGVTGSGRNARQRVRKEADHVDLSGESTGRKADTPPRSKETRRAGPKLNRAKKFTKKADDLTIEVIAFLIAYGAVSWIRTQVPLTSDEEAQFELSAHDRSVMLKPIMDIIESVSPVVVMVNNLADRWDYIECATMWWAYLSTISNFAKVRKEELDHGIIGQTQSPNAVANNGSGDVFAFG